MKLSKQGSLILRILAIVVVIAIAWSLRSRAVNLLPVDYDEDDYMRAAQEFTQLIRAGDWAGFQEANYRTEHPPLSKIIFGFGLLSAPEVPLTPDRPTTAGPDNFLPKELLHAARNIGAIFGTVTVALLALINPIGGALLAFHTFTIKYDSQVMLEALPALTSLIMVMAYLQSKKQKNKTGWLLVSAVFLGLTAASKYMYCLIAIAILIDWFLDAKEKNEVSRFLRQGALWGVVGVIIFFAADPYLWPDPIGRLKDSVLYHAGYATGASEVQSANFPFWQPFVWLSMSPSVWHADVFVIAPDLLITILGAFGLARLWKKERVYVLWLGIAIFFLLLWPTKWPQYILVLTVPLSLAAAETISLGWEKLLESLSNFRGQKEAQHFNRREVLQAIPWLVPGLIFFAIFTLFPLIFQLAISWTDFNSISIKDGMNGGVWRAVWEGLTGKAAAIHLDFPFRSKVVQFLGFRSYTPMFNWITSRGILVFNILWTVLSVGLQTVMGVGAALLLWNKDIRFRRGWQTLFILPWAIPETIGALMWVTIFASPFGWLALAVQDLGKGVPFAFLNGWQHNPNMTLVVLLTAGLWYGFPFMMLAASAGLKQVPAEVSDAAAIDGANAWQTFRHVTWPLLMPLVVPAIIIRGIFAFNQFYLIQIFAIQHKNFSMTTLATLSYNIFNPSGGFGANGQFAFSAALNIITMLVLVGFVMIFNRWTKADEGVTYA
ncbi:MAG: sugar ABC transporter permease [Chloroflexota bacterium]